MIPTDESMLQAPAEVEITAIGAYVRIAFPANVTFEDVIGASATIAQHPELVQITRQMWVFPESDSIDIDPKKLQQLVDFAAQVEIDNDMRVSIVAPTNLAFGVSRVFEALADGRGWASHVFRTTEEAKAWLEADNID